MNGRLEVIFQPRPPHVDARGAIMNLVDAPLGSAAVISSFAGAVRGNHYHRTDYHYCWLQSGRIEYYHRPVGSVSDPSCRVIEPGEIFFTPPMHEHAMRFTEDSVMVVLARNSRDMESYEADTVRVELIEG